MTISQYLEEVYSILSNRENVSFTHVVVHSCCAHFQKRVSNTVHKKFPNYKNHKNLILECIGILIHCDTLDNLDYCYEQFMTMLLISCSIEAHDCIVNITNAHSKQQTYDSDEFDINSDVENNDLFELQTRRSSVHRLAVF